MSLILALDPGVEESGFCIYDDKVIRSGIANNIGILANLRNYGADILAIEMIASYGMPVGREVFETCVWIGRFKQAWYRPDEVRLVYRKDVKRILCSDSRAKDANIRQALIDLVGPQGTKKDPGPTYGVKSHAWAALAVAVCATDKEFYAP